jgi:hypothetical protein
MDIVKQVEDGKRKYIKHRKPFARALFELEKHPDVLSNPNLLKIVGHLHRAASKGDKFGSAFFGVPRIERAAGDIIPFSGGDGK